jgi:hypothetical protein
MNVGGGSQRKAVAKRASHAAVFKALCSTLAIEESESDLSKSLEACEEKRKHSQHHYRQSDV